jgi:hypothetical protein
VKPERSVNNDERDARRLIESIFANPGWSNDQLAAAVNKFANDAATRMRDKCVGVVQAMRDEWQQRHDDLNTDAEMLDRLVLEGDIRVANEVITAIESLTLDQVVGKQEQGE